MTSNDTYLSSQLHEFHDAVDKRFDAIDINLKELRTELKELHTKTQSLEKIVLVNSTKIDTHWQATNTWFSFIAILIAIVGAVATFAAIFREIRKAKTLTEQKVQDMIDTSVSKAVEKVLTSITR